MRRAVFNALGAAAVAVVFAWGVGAIVAACCGMRIPRFPERPCACDSGTP